MEKTLRVSGMVCASCETRIQRRLAREPGAASVRVEYASGLLHLRHDAGILPLSRIMEIVGEMGYAATETDRDSAAGTRAAFARSVGVLLLLLGLAYAGNRLGPLSWLNMFPEAQAGMSLGMLFLTGALTSAHCLAMCGGINLSQTALSQTALSRKAVTGGAGALPATVLYAAGRVLSYTLIGGFVGGLGSVVSLSNGGKAGIQVAAGVFMALMGLNLMGLFSWLRRFLPRLSLPKFSGPKFSGAGRNGPFFVGLLNGFMPCGPLQAMQLFALSTGSPARGALAMLAFSLGTLPLTMGLGIFASRLGKRFMGRAVRVGAAVVFLMGVSMFGNGLVLAGLVPPAMPDGGDLIAARVEQGRQTLETTLLPNAFQPVRVRAGMPLVWKIFVDKTSLNGCNNRILIPEFSIERRLVPGENTIAFTPLKPGIYPYMCWMGMIAGRIVVGDVADSGKTPEFDASVLPEPGKEEGDIPWL